MGLEFVEERAARALGYILADSAEPVLGFISAQRAERVLGFVEKQNRPRKEYHVLNLKASQQKYPCVIDF